MENKIKEDQSRMDEFIRTIMKLGAKVSMVPQGDEFVYAIDINEVKGEAKIELEKFLQEVNKDTTDAKV